mmetsp:Transcript_15563/g.60861  ORF Transcript_15563/g.60861 Transcript_15563/m.60861 type:complete len:253 (+) Transcript_15563:259-1017(+)
MHGPSPCRRTQAGAGDAGAHRPHVRECTDDARHQEAHCPPLGGGAQPPRRRPRPRARTPSRGHPAHGRAQRHAAALLRQAGERLCAAVPRQLRAADGPACPRRDRPDGAAHRGRGRRRHAAPLPAGAAPARGPRHPGQLRLHCAPLRRDLDCCRCWGIGRAHDAARAGHRRHRRLHGAAPGGQRGTPADGRMPRDRHGLGRPGQARQPRLHRAARCRAEWAAAHREVAVRPPAVLHCQRARRQQQDRGGVRV